MLAATGCADQGAAFVGDLRNKMRKQERDEAHRIWLEKHYPPKPPAPPIRCRCGFTWHETTIWSVTGDKGEPGAFYCPACLPADLAWLVDQGTAPGAEG